MIKKFFSNINKYYFKKMLINIFLVVAVISIILITGIYISSIEGIRRVNINMNEAVLEQINKNVDNQIKYLDRVILNLGLDNSIKTFFIRDQITANADECRHDAA